MVTYTMVNKLTKRKMKRIEYLKIFNIGNFVQITPIKSIGKMNRWVGSSENNDETFTKI